MITGVAIGGLLCVAICANRRNHGHTAPRSGMRTATAASPEVAPADPPVAATPASSPRVVLPAIPVDASLIIGQPPDRARKLLGSDVSELQDGRLRFQLGTFEKHDQVLVDVQYNHGRAVWMWVLPVSMQAADLPGAREVIDWLGYADGKGLDWGVNNELGIPQVWDAKAKKKHDAQIEAADAESRARADQTARESDQQDVIVEGLNKLFETTGVDAVAGASDDDLMIVGEGCDMQVLRDLRKTLKGFDLDPAAAFDTMQCNGGPLLRLRKR